MNKTIPASALLFGRGLPHPTLFPRTVLAPRLGRSGALLQLFRPALQKPATPGARESTDGRAEVIVSATPCRSTAHK